ncbi:MAG: imidazole glycerol phosphate synthase subunit HisF [Flavobacteriales bacterium]|nr:imidazole glycerol phosphate synthase subunit HisF [Flavobacteriales bacterium]
MLKKRIIPILLIQDGLIKKPIKFQNPRTIANPVSVVRVFEERQVDELVLLDISKTTDNEDPDLMLIRKLSEELFVPFTYGGGINSIEIMIQIIKAGAEKIVLNTAAVDNPELIQEGSNIFGSQCIVVSIDVKNNGNFYEVYTNSGKKNTGINIIDHIKNMQNYGAGEFLINSIDHDGNMSGFNIDLFETIKNIVNVPVIAAGGASCLEDFISIAKEDHISAIAAGSVYHYTKITPNMVKGALHQNRFPVRICTSTDYSFNY